MALGIYLAICLIYRIPLSHPACGSFAPEMRVHTPEDGQPMESQDQPDGQHKQAGAKGIEKPLDMSGARSRIQKPRQVVARDAKALAALWHEHDAGMTPAPPPPVDFKKYDVIGVFMGAKPTGGYSVEIGEIKRTGKNAVVHATLWKPGPGMMTTQAFTSPFALRAVPKLPPNVTFDVTEKARERP
jgi:hypothetical protein